MYWSVRYVGHHSGDEYVDQKDHLIFVPAYDIDLYMLQKLAFSNGHLSNHTRDDSNDEWNDEWDRMHHESDDDDDDSKLPLPPGFGNQEDVEHIKQQQTEQKDFFVLNNKPNEHYSEEAANAYRKRQENTNSKVDEKSANSTNISDDKKEKPIIIDAKEIHQSEDGKSFVQTAKGSVLSQRRNGLKKFFDSISSSFKKLSIIVQPHHLSSKSKSNNDNYDKNSDISLRFSLDEIEAQICKLNGDGEKRKSKHSSDSDETHVPEEHRQNVYSGITSDCYKTVCEGADDDDDENHSNEKHSQQHECRRIKNCETGGDCHGSHHRGINWKLVCIIFVIIILIIAIIILVICLLKHKKRKSIGYAKKNDDIVCIQPPPRNSVHVIEKSAASASNGADDDLYFGDQDGDFDGRGFTNTNTNDDEANAALILSE